MKMKYPRESVVVEFDFSGDLDSVDSAEVSVLISGVGEDPELASFLVGDYQIAGTSVYQRIAGGLRGISYQIECLGTSGDDVILRKDIIRIVDWL